MNAASQQLQLDLRGGYANGCLRRRRRLRGIDRAESPVERQMAMALINCAAFEWRELNQHPWIVGRWRKPSLMLLSQAARGPYRVDLAIAPPEWHPSMPLPLIIEVDGHEFHERTPEQAQRDKSRDRFFSADGSVVLRFTGREVHRTPELCADEVMTLLERPAFARVVMRSLSSKVQQPRSSVADDN